MLANIWRKGSFVYYWWEYNSNTVNVENSKKYPRTPKIENYVKHHLVYPKEIETLTQKDTHTNVQNITTAK